MVRGSCQNSGLGQAQPGILPSQTGGPIPWGCSAVWGSPRSLLPAEMLEFPNTEGRGIWPNLSLPQPLLLNLKSRTGHLMFILWGSKASSKMKWTTLCREMLSQLLAFNYFWTVKCWPQVWFLNYVIEAVLGLSLCMWIESSLVNSWPFKLDTKAVQRLFVALVLKF